MPNIRITKEIAAKVLAVVDQGLSRGIGRRKLGHIQGEMCVEAAVCYALGLPHSDDPGCVAGTLRTLKIHLNDARWSSRMARSKGLRRLAVAQLNSKSNMDEMEFVSRLADHAIRVSVPRVLYLFASIVANEKYAGAILKTAQRCEREGSVDALRTAEELMSHRDAVRLLSVNEAIRTAIVAKSTFDSACNLHAGHRQRLTTLYDVALEVAGLAVSCAAVCSDVASFHSLDPDLAFDASLSDYAEAVVQILISLKVPGCQWLSLTVK